MSGGEAEKSKPSNKSKTLTLKGKRSQRWASQGTHPFIGDSLVQVCAVQVRATPPKKSDHEKRVHPSRSKRSTFSRILPQQAQIFLRPSLPFPVLHANATSEVFHLPCSELSRQGEKGSHQKGKGRQAVLHTPRWPARSARHLSLSCPCSQRLQRKGVSQAVVR